MRRNNLERVVLTVSDDEACVSSWSGADWVYFPAVSTLVVAPPNRNPKDQKPRVSIQIDSTTTDEAFVRRKTQKPNIFAKYQKQEICLIVLFYASIISVKIGWIAKIIMTCSKELELYVVQRKSGWGGSV